MVLSLICSSGPLDPKHQSLQHSIITYIGLIVSNSLLLIYLSESSVFYPTAKQLFLSFFLFVYTVILFSTRVVTDSNRYLGQITIYEMFWQCNVALVIAAIGSLIGNKEIVGAAVASIALDQSMWWVDLATYLTSGKFQIGVAKYLLWPETSWIKACTSTHHLWFIPLCIYLNEGLPWTSIKLSLAVVAYCSIYARMVIPFEIPFKGKMRYMNINCTYECWKDVNIWVLHLADRNIYLDKHFFYGFLLLNTAWSGGNSICFALVKIMLG